MPGSHGSLTKAGKVRQLTPKVPRTGVNSRSKKIPRIRNKVLYEKRVVRQRYAGQQNSINAQKHNRKVQNKR
jgi:small subunit ribosomal protein S30e